MVDISHVPPLGYMEMVQRRDAATLLTITKPLVHPNTTIYSDEWAAYHQMQQLQNVDSHQTVNHFLHFLDLVTSLHTQHVESYWNKVNGKFTRMKGVALQQMPSYVRTWMNICGGSAMAALHQLLHFLDIVTGLHTQHVESYWNKVKGKFTRMKGVALQQMPSYICTWMNICGGSAMAALHQPLSIV